MTVHGFNRVRLLPFRQCVEIPCRVGQGRGGATLVCHSMLNVAAHGVPRERRPTKGLERTFGLSVAVGVELNNGGGPARGGVCLFSRSSLLHSEYLAWRFASILRPACPTLRGVELTSGGGPARGGICLFFGSSLLHSEYLAWRFAAILRPACPTLRVIAIYRSRLQSSSCSPFPAMR